MKIDLRYTGLTSADERRVRLAANALAAHQLTVEAQAWSGNRSDALVVDSREQSGAYALVRARELAIPVLDLRAHAEDSVEMIARVVWLTRGLHQILRGRLDTPSVVSSQDAATETASPGLVELAIQPKLSGKPVHARFGGIGIWLLPQAGRVFSATVSDQLNARSRLCHPGWRFEALSVHRDWRPSAEISASLDAFYMEAVWQARDDLPRFPEGQYQLSDWPDLGAAANLVDVLRVVRALLHRCANVEEVASASGLSERDVSACLWALRASNLLSMQLDTPQKPAPASRRQSSGLWSRLAAHFGLVRAV